MGDFNLDHKGIAEKWQKQWEADFLYRAADFSKKKKFYLLVEFPYPSAAGLHVGHARSWSAMDIYARKKRMEGYNVLFPMGWDAFGLPAENYAIKTGIHPTITVKENIAAFKRQIKSLGISFDWSREIDTSDPKYYKWTQWIFIQLYKNGLAYQDEVLVNWCPFCKTNLADEEVLPDGRHERCGTLTEKRPQKQWLLRITRYADRLLDELQMVDYSEKIARQQVNWIGRSEGAEIKFRITDSDLSIRVFTTRPDTLYGATFMVLSPESKFVKELATGESQKAVSEYIETARKANRENTGLDRGQREKTGVFSGSYAINPATGKEIPVWISDYVLSSYGSGAVMAVPAHDPRDWDFARKFVLPVVEVIRGGDIQKSAYEDEGRIINSGDWDGLRVPEDNPKIFADIVKRGFGAKAESYHLHDWVFSRQHYWGEPIPMIHCSNCGTVAVPEKDLPVELPFIEKYQPSGTGESPLANATDWVNTTCPVCGGPAKRETDTMPNWAGSNWYFIRFLDPQNDAELAEKDKMAYWLPVDLYQGGFEQTTLHLLYSRFIYKFLYDIKAIPTPEPYAKRRSHGIVLGSDGRKMSKTFGNVVNPDDIVNKYGADTLRIYEMFMGPFDQVIAWSEESLEGCFRFIKRAWKQFNTGVGGKTSPALKTKLHKTIKKVGSDIENLKFNTAIAAMMELVNEWEGGGGLDQGDAKLFARILAPFAPHLAEEVWVNVLKQKVSVHQTDWPEYDPAFIQETEVSLVVQVNGKLRATLVLDNESAQHQDRVEKSAREDARVAKWLENHGIRNVIFVPGRLINFVIG